MSAIREEYDFIVAGVKEGYITSTDYEKAALTFLQVEPQALWWRGVWLRILMSRF
jgi:hypothetical protein